MGSVLLALLLGVVVVALVGLSAVRSMRPFMRYTAASPEPLPEGEVRRRERRAFWFFLPLGVLGVALGVWFGLFSAHP